MELYWVIGELNYVSWIQAVDMPNHILYKYFDMTTLSVQLLRHDQQFQAAVNFGIFISNKNKKNDKTPHEIKKKLKLNIYQNNLNYNSYMLTTFNFDHVFNWNRFA